MQPTPAIACLCLLALTHRARAGDDWSSLDEEVQALTAALADEGEEAAQLSGFINFLYANSSDVGVVPSGEDLGGFALTNVHLILQGGITGAFSYRLSADFFDGDAHVFDAYGRVAARDDLHVVIGQFRAPFLRTALLQENRYLFLLPTRNAFFYRIRDFAHRGVMLEYGANRWRAQLAVQNGQDVLADELLVSVHGSVDVLGDGPTEYEGAYGAPETAALTLGIGGSDDRSGDDGLALSVEAALTMDRLYLQAEAVSYDDDYTAADLLNGVITDPLAGRGDTDPYSLTGSYLLGTAGVWEVAARYEDLDDGLNRDALTLGVNRYLIGHDAKVLFNYRSTDSDAGDADILAVGFSLSF